MLKIQNREINVQDVLEVFSENEITGDSILYISSEKDPRGAGVIEVFESDFNTFVNGATTMVRLMGEFDDDGNFQADLRQIEDFIAPMVGAGR